MIKMVRCSKCKEYMMFRGVNSRSVNCVCSKCSGFQGGVLIEHEVYNNRNTDWERETKNYAL